jgi:hypothetical protein
VEYIYRYYCGNIITSYEDYFGAGFAVKITASDIMCQNISKKL